MQKRLISNYSQKTQYYATSKLCNSIALSPTHYVFIYTLAGLADHINLSFDKVHLIGFSLGAHVAGFAGSQLKNISRITGNFYKMLNIDYYHQRFI